MMSKTNKGKKSDKEISVDELKKEIEAEQKAKDTIEWSNMELERSVRAMEMNVLQLEAGNLDADDSEGRQKYENQKQLNLQLMEQKRWLEHELEQIKLKIQNEKIDLPDPFSLDWDNLSETELKRLVAQLEKTKNDLRSDLREMQFRLDKEGKEYHHYDEFAKMYQAEIKNLNRIMDSLMRTGAIPPKLLQTPQSTSQTSSFPSTGGLPTPGGAVHNRKSSSLSPPRRPITHTVSPTRTFRKISPDGKRMADTPNNRLSPIKTMDKKTKKSGEGGKERSRTRSKETKSKKKTTKDESEEEK